jgi:hypothetical protein
LAQELTRITEACEAFVSSLQEGRYYDAHNDLEHLWYPRRFDKEDEVLLWKGFISAAVSFELLKRGRPEASQKAWQTYLKYLPLSKTLVTPHKELYDKIVKLIEKKVGNV